MLPALFVSHGAPTLPFDDVPARDFLRELGQKLGKPRAIVVVSAHWDTDQPQSNGVSLNDTIHDFGGFPRALYDIRYPAPGDALLAREITALTGGTVDAMRGLDHGAWVPLMLMYPQADVPVVQLSLDRNMTPRQHLALGRALGPLRDEGVLIVGSGDIVHNLRVDFRRPGVEPWALAFNEQAKSLILAGNAETLADYPTLGPPAIASINSGEHFLPLLYALAVRRDGDQVRFFNDDVFAALSMTSVVIGG